MGDYDSTCVVCWLSTNAWFSLILVRLLGLGWGMHSAGCHSSCSNERNERTGKNISKIFPASSLHYICETRLELLVDTILSARLVCTLSWQASKHSAQLSFFWSHTKTRTYSQWKEDLKALWLYRVQSQPVGRLLQLCRKVPKKMFEEWKGWTTAEFWVHFTSKPIRPHSLVYCSLTTVSLEPLYDTCE